MAEELNLDNEAPNVEARGESINSGTTEIKNFLPFGTGFHNPNPNLFTINPEPVPVQVGNPRSSSETPTIQKDPIRDTTVGFNPFDKKQLSQSKDISQDYTKNLIQRMNHDLMSLQDNQQYAKSFMYDASSSGAHKARYKAYGQETFDKIGFNPELNNEEVFNANTSIMDDFIRMGTHAAWPMFTNGILANPKSYAQIFQGNIGQDIDAAEDYEEYNAIGMSTKGGIGGFLNNTLNSLAYSAGIMFEAAAEYAAIGAIEGSLVGPEGTVLGGALGGATGALKGLLSVPKNLWNMGKYGGKMLTNLKNVENYAAAKNAFIAASKGTWDFVNPLNNTQTAFTEASNLSGLARTAKTSAGFFRDVIGINMGLSEGRLEGGFVENNTYSKLYDKFWQKMGRAPTDEEQMNMRKQAKVAGFQDTWKNALLVFYSNKIAFPNLVKGNIFAGKSRTIRSVGKEFDIVFEAGKGTTGQALKEGAYNLVDYNFKNALKGFIKPANFGKATLTYFKTNLTEGAQEVMQDVLAKSTEDYYVNSFYDPSKATFDYSMATLGNAFGHQVSGQGFETFMSGFVMGGLLKPFGGAVPRTASILYNKYTMDPVEYEKYIEERRGYGEAIKNAMNNMHQNPVEFLNERMRNYGDQNIIAKIHNDDETDKKEGLDAAHAGFLSDVLTSLNAGTFKVFRDNFGKYDTLTDKELEETLELEKGEGSKMRKILSEYLKESDTIQKDWDYAQKNLASKKLNLQNYKENTPEYDKAAIYNKAIDRGIYNLVFLKNSYTKNLERVNGIVNKFNASKLFRNMPSADFQTLLDSKKLSNTIDMLSTEIESLKNIQSVDSQNQIKQKSEMLDALSQFEKAQNAFNEMQSSELLQQAKEEATKQAKEKGEEDTTELENSFDEVISYFNQNGGDPIQGYKDAFENLIKTISGSEYDYQKAMMDLQSVGGLDSIFNDLKDLHKLEHENKNIIPYINLLSQPASFYEHVERNFEWMHNMYLNRENYYKEIINQSIKAKENNDLLKSLADQNIYVDLEEFADWVEDPNNLPSYFIDANKGNERIIPRGSLLYEKYAQLFIMVGRMQQETPAGDPVDVEGQLEIAIQDLLGQKQNEIDQAEEYFKKDIKEETGLSLEELQQQEAEGEEVTKPISEDTINRKTGQLQELIDSLDSDDPIVVLDALKNILQTSGLTEEQYSQEIIDNEIYKLQNSPERLKSEVVPIYTRFEDTYDVSNREEAAYAAAAAKAILNAQIERIKTSTEDVTEIVHEEIIKNTQSWKDYQAVLAEIDERYARSIQELTDNFAKKGVTPSTITNDIPLNTSWAELEKLAPELFQTLSDRFTEEIALSPEDDKYDLVRANWLEQQGGIIKEYNAQKAAEKILRDQEAKQFKIPKLKFIKLPNGYEINITSRISPLTLLRDTYQNMLNSGERVSEKTGKILKLTAKQKQDIADDLESLDAAISFLREQGVQTENSSFDTALQAFNDLIIARQNEIEKVLDENGNLIERRINGKVADRVTKKAEELDISLIEGKEQFNYYALKPLKRTVTDENGEKTKVEIPSPILSAFDSIMEDKSIKDDDKLEAFIAAFEAFEKSKKTSVFKDKNQKGLNAEKFRALREALEDTALEQPSDIKAQKADIERRRQEELDKINQRIEKLKQKEDRRVKTETYRTLNINDNPVEVEITTNADGSRVLRARQLNEDGSVEPMAYATERINNKAQRAFTNEKLIKEYIGDEGNTLQRINVDKNPDQTYINKINAKYDAELAALEDTDKKTNVGTKFTRENVIKAINELAFREAAEIGNMIDNLIKDFLTREGLIFKKVEKPEKMSQKAFDALFGSQGTITKFRDGIIDGDYIVVGASDMLFDKELFENGLVGETDLIAINAEGEFNIIDVKALKKGSWDRFNSDTELEDLKDKLASEGKTPEEIEQDSDVIKLTEESKWSKKQYFRIQQSLYRNLFFNMTGIMPTRIGLMPLEVEYDTEGNLINAKLADIVPEDNSTVELEYFPEVESIVPLKEIPKETVNKETKEEGLVEQEEGESTLLKSNVGKQVVYAGNVGTLILNNNGTYSVKSKEGVEDLYFEQQIVNNGDLSFDQVGVSPIRKVQKPFETIVINGEKYTTKILGENTAEINGVVYRINWSSTGPERTIVSLSYRANDAEISKLEAQKEDLEKRIEVGRSEYNSYLPKNQLTDYNRRIESIKFKLATLSKEDAAIKDELLKTRAALEKELFYARVKQNSKMQQIGVDRIELDKINIKLNQLKENNPKRTMRGGNINDYVFAINSSPENFKLHKGKNGVDQKKDLDSIAKLSVSSATAVKIDAILAENFPDALNQLIDSGVGAIGAVGISAIYNWANNVIVELEQLGSKTAVQGNLTTDIDNQINAIYDLLNDLELIKLNKNGEISKRQPKEITQIFGANKVSERSSIPKNEESINEPSKGVSGSEGGRPSAEEMKQKIVENNITTENILSSIDVEEAPTTKKGAKFINTIKNATAETLDTAYIAALEELKANPGSINSTELADAYASRSEELKTDLSIKSLSVNTNLLPKNPIFGNTEISPVYVNKIGPKSVEIKDIMTGQTETFTEEELGLNFIRMTEEAMEKEQGVELTPEDVEDFKKNTETINDTLEDSEALNAAAKAVEEAETKGSFRDRLKNKKCNI